MRSDDLYDLADEQAPKLGAKLPASPAPAKVGEGAVTPVGRVVRAQPIAYQCLGAIGENTNKKYFPDLVRDLYAPLALIGGGLIVSVIYSWLFVDLHGPGTLLFVLRWIGLNILAETAILVVAILIAAKLRHIDLGSFLVALMKLSATVVGTKGVILLIGPLLQVILSFVPYIGGLLFIALPFGCYFTFLGTFFDLDESDSKFCVCVLFLVDLGIFFAFRTLS